MSLYGDIYDDDDKNNDKHSWSGIKLLENHLLSRKKSNQSKVRCKLL